MEGLLSGVALLHADLLRKGVGGSIRYSPTGNHRPSVILVGAGRMGRHHARALARGNTFRLVGVVDPLEPDWADVHWESGLEQALERLCPDAAIVAVPSHLHGGIARQCLGAGCHVLLEKPLCPSLAEATALALDFRARRRVLFGGHSERFHPVFGALSRSLEGESVESIRAVRTGPRPDRAVPDDLLLDLAIHDVDLASRLVAPLRRVGCQSMGVDSKKMAFLGAGGCDVQIQCQYQLGRTRRWEVRTSRAWFEADFLGRTLRQIRQTGTCEVEVEEGDPLEREHRAFRRALEGRSDPLDLAHQIESIGLLEPSLG